jgi:UrcA family protein
MTLKATLLAGGLAASFSFILAAPSFADSSVFDQSYRTTVRTADYNLDQPKDVAALYRTLRVAAGHVCGPRSMTGSIGASPGYEQCVANAMAQAVARMDSEPLTSYYQEQLEQSRKLATAQ